MTDKKPLVIGIAGGTCSGKSTLADLLKEALAEYAVEVLHMDSFFKENPPTVIAPFSGREYPEHNHPDALDLPRMYQSFDRALNGMADVVIIEGLFALYLPEIYTRCNLRLFVELRPEERFCRRIRRHMAMGQTFDEITDRYLDTVCLRHDELIEPTKNRADLILSGTFRHRGVDWLCDAVAAHLSSSKTREEIL
ncbi:MAG: AAA family ATPase [Oscillospiraceae bacterium]|nr:AAA family ATPase [Oscillospiraceae bacterium]MDY3066191.1 AAA family ATPase [Oscillospiraceae bacterium]